MCSEGSAKARYKRLHRFLENPSFQNGKLSSRLLELVEAANPPSLCYFSLCFNLISQIEITQILAQFSEFRTIINSQRRLG